MPSVDWAIAESVRRWVGVKPDAPCITFGPQTWTWLEVFERSCRIGQAVQSLGVQPGDRVIFLGKNRSEFFEILLGVSMAGGVTGAANWRLSPKELQYIIEHCQASMLFVEAEFLPALSEIRDQLTHVANVIVLDTGSAEAGEAGQWNYEPLLALQPAKDPEVVVSGDDIGLQMYTSGTTGLPKGAMFSNRALQSNQAMAELTGVDDHSTVLVAMPVFHASGSSLGILSLRSGARMVIAREIVPADLLSSIAEYRVTMTTLVPAVLKMMIESPAINGADLSSLDTIAYAASPISEDLLRACLRIFGCRFLQIYGLTETNGVTALLPEDHLDPLHPERMLSAGRAMTGNAVRIVDPNTGIDVAEGEFGEVLLQAPTSMSGYFDNEAETSAQQAADGFLRTGDGGYLQDGYLYLRDRIKDMIVTGGENVFSVEVENVLSSDPRINDVAVIGVPSDRWGESVKAIVVRESGHDQLAADDVIEFAKANLARYKSPTSVEFVTELPRNPSGKILKRVLREQFGGAAPQ